MTRSSNSKSETLVHRRARHRDTRIYFYYYDISPFPVPPPLVFLFVSGLVFHRRDAENALTTIDRPGHQRSKDRRVDRGIRRLARRTTVDCTLPVLSNNYSRLQRGIDSLVARVSRNERPDAKHRPSRMLFTSIGTQCTCYVTFFFFSFFFPSVSFVSSDPSTDEQSRETLDKRKSIFGRSDCS